MLSPPLEMARRQLAETDEAVLTVYTRPPVIAKVVSRGWCCFPQENLKDRGFEIFLPFHGSSRYRKVCIPAMWSRVGTDGLDFDIVRRELWIVLEDKGSASASTHVPWLTISRGHKPLSTWTKWRLLCSSPRAFQRLRQPDGGPVGSIVSRVQDLLPGNLYLVRKD
jgi:hypothetical protein